MNLLVVIRYLVTLISLLVSRQTVLSLEIDDCFLGDSDLNLISVAPIKYSLNIEPNFNFETYRGIVDISIQTYNDGNVVNAVKYFKNLLVTHESQQLLLKIDRSLIVTDIKYFDLGTTEKPIKENELKVTEMCRDNTNSLLMIKVKGNFKHDRRAILKIDFTGPFQKRHYKTRGFYQTTDDVTSSLFGMTRLKPDAAHYFFPHINLPSSKVVYELKIRIINEELKPVSTTELVEHQKLVMRGGGVCNEYHFAETDEIDSFSLGFALGQFDTIDSKSRSGKLVRIHAKIGQIERAKFALEAALLGLSWMEDYMGSEYFESKLDIVAIPNQDGIPVADLSLAVLNESSVLLDANIDSKENRFNIALDVFYVIANQWFGNRLSPTIIDATRTLEAISLQKAYEMVQSIYPELGGDYLIHSKVNENFIYFSIYDLPPIDEENINIQSQMDYLVFNEHLIRIKNAAIIQMIHNMIGPERLKQSLRNVFLNNAEQRTTTKELFEEFDSSGLLESMKIWLYVQTIPTISIDQDKGSLLISQKSSSLLKNLRNVVWTIHLTILFSGGHDRQQLITTTLDSEKKLIDVPEWFKFGQQGYFVKVSPNPDLSTFFMIRYSDSLLNHLKYAIENKSISPLDRIHIINDIANFLRLKKFKLDRFKEVVSWFSQEDNERVLKYLEQLAIKVKDVAEDL